MSTRKAKKSKSTTVARTPLGIAIYQPTRLDAVCKYTVGSFIAAGAAFAAVNLSASSASADDFGSGGLGDSFSAPGAADFGVDAGGFDSAPTFVPEAAPMPDPALTLDTPTPLPDMPPQSAPEMAPPAPEPAAPAPEPAAPEQPSQTQAFTPEESAVVEEAVEQVAERAVTAPEETLFAGPVSPGDIPAVSEEQSDLTSAEANADLNQQLFGTEALTPEEQAMLSADIGTIAAQTAGTEAPSQPQVPAGATSAQLVLGATDSRAGVGGSAALPVTLSNIADSGISTTITPGATVGPDGKIAPNVSGSVTLPTGTTVGAASTGTEFVSQTVGEDGSVSLTSNPRGELIPGVLIPVSSDGSVKFGADANLTTGAVGLDLKSRDGSIGYNTDGTIDGSLRVSDNIRLTGATGGPGGTSGVIQYVLPLGGGQSAPTTPISAPGSVVQTPASEQASAEGEQDAASSDLLGDSFISAGLVDSLASPTDDDTNIASADPEQAGILSSAIQPPASPAIPDTSTPPVSQFVNLDGDRVDVFDNGTAIVDSLDGTQGFVDQATGLSESTGTDGSMTRFDPNTGITELFAPGAGGPNAAPGSITYTDIYGDPIANPNDGAGADEVRQLFRTKPVDVIPSDNVEPGDRLSGRLAQGAIPGNEIAFAGDAGDLAGLGLTVPDTGLDGTEQLLAEGASPWRLGTPATLTFEDLLGISAASGRPMDEVTSKYRDASPDEFDSYLQWVDREARKIYEANPNAEQGPGAFEIDQNRRIQERLNGDRENRKRLQQDGTPAAPRSDSGGTLLAFGGDTDALGSLGIPVSGEGIDPEQLFAQRIPTVTPIPVVQSDGARTGSANTPKFRDSAGAAVTEALGYSYPFGGTIAGVSDNFAGGFSLADAVMMTEAQLKTNDRLQQALTILNDAKTTSAANAIRRSEQIDINTGAASAAGRNAVDQNARLSSDQSRMNAAARAQVGLWAQYNSAEYANYRALENYVASGRADDPVPVQRYLERLPAADAPAAVTQLNTWRGQGLNNKQIATRFVDEGNRKAALAAIGYSPSTQGDRAIAGSLAKLDRVPPPPQIGTVPQVGDSIKFAQSMNDFMVAASQKVPEAAPSEVPDMTIPLYPASVRNGAELQLVTDDKAEELQQAAYRTFLAGSAGKIGDGVWNLSKFGAKSGPAKPSAFTSFCSTNEVFSTPGCFQYAVNQANINGNRNNIALQGEVNVNSQALGVQGATNRANNLSADKQNFDLLNTMGQQAVGRSADRSNSRTYDGVVQTLMTSDAIRNADSKAATDAQKTSVGYGVKLGEFAANRDEKVSNWNSARGNAGELIQSPELRKYEGTPTYDRIMEVVRQSRQFPPAQAGAFIEKNWNAIKPGLYNAVLKNPYLGK